MQEKEKTPTGGLEFLVRFYWLILGNGLLFMLLVLIFEKRARFPSLLDGAYLAAAALLIAMRYVDIRFFNGQTGEGQPATMAHWRRYSLVTGCVTLGAWLMVHVLTRVLR